MIKCDYEYSIVYYLYIYIYIYIYIERPVESNYRILMDIYASFSASGIPPLTMWKDSR